MATPATLHLHVGAPKSGSTYLQQALHDNASDLRSVGMLVPGRHLDHFRFAAWMLDQHHLMPRPRKARDAGMALLDEVRAWFGGQGSDEADAGGRSALISHELLAGATTAQVRRLEESLPGVRLRVHYVARPLSRTLPAEWQQAVKGGSGTTLADFVDEVMRRFGDEVPGTDPAAQPAVIGESDLAAKFATLHDIASVLPRWAAAIGEDALTVLTMPTAGGHRTELWRRFLDALELPQGRFSVPEQARPNVSLGAVDAEMLRRVNVVRGSLDNAGHVRNLAHRLIKHSPNASTPIVVPEAARTWACLQSERMVAHLKESGCRLVGDPEELLVHEADFPRGPTPDDLDPEMLLEASVRAVARLLGDLETRT